MDGEWEAEAVIALEESAISAPRFTDPTIDQVRTFIIREGYLSIFIRTCGVDSELEGTHNLFMGKHFIFGLHMNFYSFILALVFAKTNIAFAQFF